MCEVSASSEGLHSLIKEVLPSFITRGSTRAPGTPTRDETRGRCARWLGVAPSQSIVHPRACFPKQHI